MLTQFKNWLTPSPPRLWGLYQIEASLECTLDCVMCPWSALRPEKALMSMETFQRIAAGFDQVRSVDLTGGGEPLLNPNLAEMVAMASQAGCQVGFSTNGFHLDQALAFELLEAGLDWISFSVDAATAKTYQQIRRGSEFGQVLHNMQAFHHLAQSRPGKPPQIMLVFVVMQANFHELPAMIDMARQVGATTLIAKNLDVILKGEDDQRRIFSHEEPLPVDVVEALEQTQQRARANHIELRQYQLTPHEQPVCEHDPLHSIFFNWEGRVSPCITLAYAAERYFEGHPLKAPTEIFGDIHHQSLTEIWTSPAYQAFRRRYQQRQSLSRRAAMEALLSQEPTVADLPPAPEGCRTCYYLYGV
jgi:MoaA/NifB/PqqE/SkfB family radical SAM enzyme